MSSRRSAVVSVVVAMLLVAAPAAAQTFITSASAVRLRAEPDSQAAVVAVLALGTPLANCDGARDAWLHVETADGRVGWVHGAFVIPAPAAGSERTIDDLVRARLRRTQDGLEPRLELVAFIERTLAAMPVGPRAAAFDLYRLKATAAVLEAMPFGADPGADLRAWIAARDATVAYDEAAGRYRLKPEAIRRAHDRHRVHGDATGEPFLWLLVTTGFGGDCEGSLTCYVARTDAAEGEYLRWYPEGRFVGEALRRIMERAAWWRMRTDTGLGFDPATDCRDVGPLLGTLRFGVESAAHADRAKAVELIDAVRWRCR